MYTVNSIEVRLKRSHVVLNWLPWQRSFNQEKISEAGAHECGLQFGLVLVLQFGRSLSACHLNAF